MLRDEIAEKYGISREWNCNDDFIWERCLKFADAILELLKDKLAKAEKFDSIKDMFPDFLEHGREWKEKAEKWDKFHSIIEFNKQHLNVVDQLDLILKDKMVRENCPEEAWDSISHRGHALCGGEGYTTRPATAEELAEFLEASLKFDSQMCEEYGSPDYELRVLKSGNVLFMVYGQKGKKK